MHNTGVFRHFPTNSNSTNAAGFSRSHTLYEQAEQRYSPYLDKAIRIFVVAIAENNVPLLSQAISIYDSVGIRRTIFLESDIWESLNSNDDLFLLL